MLYQVCCILQCNSDAADAAALLLCLRCCCCCCVSPGNSSSCCCIHEIDLFRTMSRLSRPRSSHATCIVYCYLLLYHDSALESDVANICYGCWCGGNEQFIGAKHLPKSYWKESPHEENCCTTVSSASPRVCLPVHQYLVHSLPLCPET